MPIADQQEGKEAGQLPKENELDQVAGEHDAEHCPHEGEKERIETRHRIGWREIIARVKHHQKADASDQQGEHPGEAVHPQVEFKAKLGNPGCLILDHPAVGDLGVACEHEYQRRERDAPCQVSFGITSIGREQRGKAASGKRERD